MLKINSLQKEFNKHIAVNDNLLFFRDDLKQLIKISDLNREFD